MIKTKLSIILILLLFLGCNQSNNKQVSTQNVKSDTLIQQKNDITNSSTTNNAKEKTINSITITATAKGRISHIQIAKDRALLNAKKQLADSLYQILSINDTTKQHNYSKKLVQITLTNMSIVNEGVKHYNKKNKSKIEAYVTVHVDIENDKE